MRSIIVGTAGHVDHGKTTLIKALTGADTDRLPEEKKRGISIDLGFAPFRLPDGQLAGVVDVPGHERFIKNMLAGVAGMDVVLLVVAADEGVMPQTEEHLDILSLAGVRSGIIVLNKVDLVDREWLEMVEADVREAVKGTPFADAPLVAVSAVTGEGLDELRRAIAKAASEAAREALSPFLRLPIDRVFSIKGHGTVVTGTLVGGRVAAGDEVEIAPALDGIIARVRRVEVHDEKVDQAVAGQRVALNLAGVEAGELRRGQVVIAPGTMSPTWLIDVRLKLLSGAWPRLAHRARVRVHMGTAEILGRVSLLENDELAAGEEAYAQLFLEEPVVCLVGDRLVIRSYSPARTIGGGVVLNAHPPRRKRHRPEVVAELSLEDRGRAEDLAFLELKRRHGEGPLKVSGLARATGQPEDVMRRFLSALEGEKKVVRLPQDRFLAAEDAEDDAARALAEVAGFHKANPLSAGMSREELRTKAFPRWDVDGYDSFIVWLTGLGRLQMREGGLLAVPGFAVQLAPLEVRDAARIEEFYQGAGVAPPNPEEAAASLGISRERHDTLAAVLVERGQLVKAPGGLYFHRDAVESARSQARLLLEETKSLVTGRFRDAIGASRRHAIALLELFDEERFTRRAGDIRTAGPRFR